MKAEVKHKEALIREISVEIPAETVSNKIEQKLLEVQRQAELKGFRRGKAPMNMIRSIYGDSVKADVAEAIIKDSYPQIVREKTLNVASYPTVTDLNFTEDGGFNYTATVEVFPEIEKVIYDGLELERREFEIKDEEVNEVVELLRKRHSELRPVERPSGATDVLLVDIKKLHDPKNVLSVDHFDESEVDLGNQLTVKEFREQLKGLKVGDEREVEVKYPDDYSDSKFAGAELKYRAKVKAVKERLMMEPDDAFAKTTGQAETMLELRMKIREQLKHQKTDEQNRMHKNQAISFLCEKNQIPVPQSLVNDYLNQVVADFKKQYKDQTLDEAEIRKNYEPLGMNTLRWNMLMHQLANQEQIQVMPSDMEKLVQRFAENYQVTVEQAKESLQKSGNLADLRESMLEEKVIDYLIGKAKLTTADKKE